MKTLLIISVFVGGVVIGALINNLFDSFVDKIFK